MSCLFAAIVRQIGGFLQYENLFKVLLEPILPLCENIDLDTF